MNTTNAFSYNHSKNLNNGCVNENAVKGTANTEEVCLDSSNDNVLKNNHVEQKSRSHTSAERGMPQEVEQNCHEKSESRPSKWHRRDSFSSCSSDSAVFCSLRHMQQEPVLRDSKGPDREVNGNLRHRHSSGSSALSSASDSSNKETVPLPVKDILSCLGHSSEKVFPQMESKITTETKVSSTQSSLSCLSNTITSQSEIETIVEEKTVSYTCKARSSTTNNNELMHNLRRQIRRKTCHNCDCSSSHTTFVVRRYTQIQRASVPPKTSRHQESKTPQLSHNQHTPPEVVSCIEETEVTVNESMPSSSSDKSQKKRRSEMDKLYDALHEIQWAKHISPDNILSQIDFRRAATESSYSSKPPQSPSAAKTFKAPKSPRANALSASPPKVDKVCKSPYATRSRGAVSTAKQSNEVPIRSKVDRSTRRIHKKSLETTTVKAAMNSDQLPDSPLRDSECASEPDKVMPDRIDQECCTEVVMETQQPLESEGLSRSEPGSEEVAGAKTSHDTEMPLSPSNASDAFANLEEDQCSRDISTEERSKVCCEIVSDDAESVENGTASSADEVVLFGCLYPNVLDDESSTVCCDETLLMDTDSDMTCPVISPPLPVLTKILPVTEHSAEGGPPRLEPCAPLIVKPKSDMAENQYASENKDYELASMSSGQSELFSLDQEEHEKSGLCNRVTIEFMNRTEEVKSYGRKVPIYKKSLKTYRTASTNLHVVKRKLFRKYFSKSSSKLKTIIRCHKRYCSPVVQESHEEESIPPSTSSTGTTSNFPSTVSLLNKEYCDQLIKNDSLRVKLEGLDFMTIMNHMPQYSHLFRLENEVSCESVTSSVLRMSKMTTSGHVQYVEESQSKVEQEKKRAPKRKKVLPLEYKEDTESPIPYRFSHHYRTIIVNKNDGYTQVVFKVTDDAHTYLTVQALNELRDAVMTANDDSSCQVLIMNSSGRSFCLGLDLRPILGCVKVDVVKPIAVAVKNFIEALAAFNKPLVVVVNGAAIGLGVTMLAYSDVILSSDSATYLMPYSSLGFCPEGGATLMLPFVVGSTVAMDMLLRGRELTAQEAYGYGLVSEVLLPSQIPDKLVERVQKLAESPSSAMESTKSMLRMHLYQRLGVTLENETEILAKQWLTESCQSALARVFPNVKSP